MKLQPLYIFLLFSILLLGFYLRMLKLDSFPEQGETLDEYAWVMVGEGLLKEGVPRSWTYFAYHKTTIQNIVGYSLPVAKPALDHPPLFALYAGLTQHFLSSSNEFLDLYTLRLPMVFLSVLNLFLFYFVAYRYLKGPFAILATALYATSPSVVLANRLIIAENMLITLILLAIVVIEYSIFKKYRSLLLFLLCFAAPLVKITGIFLPISIALFVIVSKEFNYKKLLVPILGVFTGLATFLMHGAAYDFQQFVSVQLQQSANRNPGLATFFITNFLGQK